jgi:hypothetical protein
VGRSLNRGPVSWPSGRCVRAVVAELALALFFATTIGLVRLWDSTWRQALSQCAVRCTGFMR